MTGRCPQCGAVYHDERTCQSIFDEFLALEFTDAGYGAVHFLTVACFMVQHGQYSDAGLVWIEQKLRDHLENGVPVEQIRQQANQEAAQDKRAWKVTRQPAEPPLAPIAWSMTIVDVANQTQDAATYREKIRQWARVTLQEMQPWLPGSR